MTLARAPGVVAFKGDFATDSAQDGATGYLECGASGLYPRKLLMQAPGWVVSWVTLRTTPKTRAKETDDVARANEAQRGAWGTALRGAGCCRFTCLTLLLPMSSPTGRPLRVPSPPQHPRMSSGPFPAHTYKHSSPHHPSRDASTVIRSSTSPLFHPAIPSLRTALHP